MEQPSSVPVTRLLKAWSGGDTGALAELTPLVYGELHRIARLHMAKESGGHMLQPSALVNEAFLRLVGGAQVDWADRAHFFAVSARLMKSILIDFARARDAVRRGEGVRNVELAEAGAMGQAAEFVDLIELGEALEALGLLSAQQQQVIELRYFGGLENKEIAQVLGISEPTVTRQWRRARAWLYARLQPSPI